MTSIDSLFDGSDAHLLCEHSPQYLAGFEAGKRVMARLAGLPAPELYACTKCGGANYGCKCESLNDCTKPLYSEPPVQQGEPVGVIEILSNRERRCGPVIWTVDINALPDGTKLYTAPPTCFSAGDMAEAQAKAFRSSPDLSAVIARLERWICEWQRSVCNEELLMLRQQVKELEDAADEYKQLHGFAVNGFNRLTEELAALPVQQGETEVFIRENELAMVNETGFAHVELSRISGEGRIPLYTAPPTCFSTKE